MLAPLNFRQPLPPQSAFPGPVPPDEHAVPDEVERARANALRGLEYGLHYALTCYRELLQRGEQFTPKDARTLELLLTFYEGRCCDGKPS